MKAREAQRLFDELNKRYWRGRLPRYRVIRRAALGDRAMGLCNNKTRTILLLQSLDGEKLRLTLLHEMCHIGKASEYPHGPQFLKKLHRLARLGEPQLLEDIEQYDGTTRGRQIAAARLAGQPDSEVDFFEMIQDDLEILVQAPGSPPRWPQVRRWLTNRYKISPSQLDRLAPWAEREWRLRCSEERQEERA